MVRTEILIFYLIYYLFGKSANCLIYCRILKNNKVQIVPKEKITFC
ncbi:hypothetical protein HMPREF9071_0092 [Capnocytophaga sp. oral taxon 338 str. F0234]|nr:hypothetical protein HMPREF9071_0092 [Capnocytophaga sp. oral taxon 338 str. F0234]